MASQKHQFIVGLVIKKIRQAGYEITAVDGKYPGLLGDKLPTPPTVLRHRPDVVGINEAGQVCIGEAKTEEDAFSKRTIEQIDDFSMLELNGFLCELTIGVPADIKTAFVSLLRSYGFISRKNINVFYVPSEIISDKTTKF
ncbi:MAG: hypothetical protein KGZ93_10685 [Actinobacteria bacterium]|nr:hypothetical protein [Actinomycetota bacterium]